MGAGGLATDGDAPVEARPLVMVVAILGVVAGETVSQLLFAMTSKTAMVLASPCASVSAVTASYLSVDSSC